MFFRWGGGGSEGGGRLTAEQVHGVGQVIFQHIADGANAGGFVAELVFIVLRDEQDAGFRPPRQERTGGREAVDAGHRDVHPDPVWEVLRISRHRFRAAQALDDVGF